MGGVCGGGFDSVGSANTPGNDSTAESGNSLKEILANFFTPDDNMKYEDGVLMNTSQGEGNYTKVKDEAGAFTNIPEKSNNINVTNTNRDNRIFNPTQQNKFTQENTAKEILANILTPFDGAKYLGGNLINQKTGQSLTGGGYATNKAGVKNYIYGVADDFTNNAQPKQGGMSNEDYAVALKVFKRQQSQLQNIAPSNAEYITSFLPGLVVPGLGDYFGGKMLEGGINARRANMDQHQAALDGGATPEMSKDGNSYLGYNKNGTFMPYIEEPTAPVVNAEQSDGNDSQDPLLDPSLGGLGSGVYDPYSATDDNDEGKVVIPPVEVTPIPENKNLDENAILYAGPMYEYWQDNFLPELLRSMPNITTDQIDESFRIYRDRQKRLASPRPSPKTIY